MKLGATSISVVSDGTFLLDGGSVFGQVPKAIWEQQMKPDRRNRIRLGLNCLLIQTPSREHPRRCRRGVQTDRQVSRRVRAKWKQTAKGSQEGGIDGPGP